MFYDQATVLCIAGKGGNGCVAYRKERYIAKGGPWGGNGGMGGSILIQGDENITSLDFFSNKKALKAQKGQDGGISLKTGKKGQDLIVKVPLGTLIKDEKKTLLADITEHNETFVLAQGGRGGRGNASFKSSTHQTPNFATNGKPGEEKRIHLELKIIADVGLVGLPNVGKSTLLNSLCHTKAKVGNYTFTTLHPNIGAIESEEYIQLTIADIPGIIEKASQNKGLGLAFLKHIERTQKLLFVLDASQNPLEEFVLLKNEIEQYNNKLLKKPFLIVLNKCDLDNTKENIEAIKKAEIVNENSLFTISALDPKTLDPLKKALFNS